MTSRFSSRPFVCLAAFCAAAFLCLSARANVSVGDQPALKAKATNGSSVNLEQMHGKLVLIDFWATWCGPCMQEAPHMVQINQKYASKGLVLIGVSLDRDAGEMQKGAKEAHLDWTQVMDNGSKISNQFGVDSIPRTFL